MYTEEFKLVAGAAAGKANFLKNNFAGYMALSILAGMFIGFGILISFTIGGLLDGAPYTKIAMGASFGIALSLVVMAGAELFTGNNMVMVIGNINKTATAGDTAKVWIACYIGNLIGSIILAALFYGTGLADGATGEFMAAGALAKMSAPAWQLFIRGILCNMLVCLAVWCSFRCKNEVAKLIMIFWCLFVFVTCGFEHSIANMTLLTESLINPCGQAVSIAGFVKNIAAVTLGNMAGGIIFVAFPYYAGAMKALRK